LKTFLNGFIFVCIKLHCCGPLFGHCWFIMATMLDVTKQKCYYIYIYSCGQWAFNQCFGLDRKRELRYSGWHEMGNGNSFYNRLFQKTRFLVACAARTFFFLLFFFLSSNPVKKIHLTHLQFLSALKRRKFTLNNNHVI